MACPKIRGWSPKINYASKMEQHNNDIRLLISTIKRFISNLEDRVKVGGSRGIA